MASPAHRAMLAAAPAGWSALFFIAHKNVDRKPYQRNQNKTDNDGAEVPWKKADHVAYLRFVRLYFTIRHSK